MLTEAIIEWDIDCCIGKEVDRLPGVPYQGGSFFQLVLLLTPVVLSCRCEVERVQSYGSFSFIFLFRPYSCCFPCSWPVLLDVALEEAIAWLLGVFDQKNVWEDIIFPFFPSSVCIIQELGTLLWHTSMLCTICSRRG